MPIVPAVYSGAWSLPVASRQDSDTARPSAGGIAQYEPTRIASSATTVAGERSRFFTSTPICAANAVSSPGVRGIAPASGRLQVDRQVGVLETGLDRTRAGQGRAVADEAQVDAVGAAQQARD